MTTFFAFSLTASLIVLLLYPVFNLQVSRCRAFQFNRILILVGIAIAILTPIVMPMWAIQAELPTFSSIDEVSLVPNSDDSTVQQMSQTAENSNGNIIALIICLYWSGVGFLLIREAIAYIRLVRIISKTERIRSGDYTICKHGDNNLAPFSWGRYIIVADSKIEGPILIHEKAHVAKRHWIDVAIADIFCIFLWYNPFAWMLKNLMKLNHEYDADAKVIDSETDILDYQRLLIAKAIGNRTLPIANNFAMSKRDFRKRVLIMGHLQSSPNKRWIALLVVPALAVALYANATPLSSGIINSFSSYTFGDFSPDLSTDEIAPTEATPVEKAVSATIITKRLPSPINDPEPLLKQFEISIDAADKELLPDKILARIEVDEEGNIERVTTNHDNNTNVRAVVDKATNGLQFEMVMEDGKKIKTRFAIPIIKSNLPY